MTVLRESHAGQRQKNSHRDPHTYHSRRAIIAHRMTFRSKIDRWVYLILALTIVTPFAVVLPGYIRGETGAVVFLVPALAMLVVGVLFGCIAAPVRYTLDKTELVIRSGLLLRRLPYGSITAAFPTRNPLSSPALSTDRLQIEFIGGYVLISPERRQEFLDELARRARLKRSGDRLARK
jgi:hypothetical protein